MRYRKVQQVLQDIGWVTLGLFVVVGVVAAIVGLVVQAWYVTWWVGAIATVAGVGALCGLTGWVMGELP